MNLATIATVESPHSEARIDRILAALTSPEIPDGLEDRLAQRVAGRLALAAKNCAGSDALNTLTHEPPALSLIVLRLPAAKQPRLWATASLSYAVPAALLSAILVLITLNLHDHNAPASTSSASMPARPITPQQAPKAAGAIARAQTPQIASLRVRPGQASPQATRNFTPEANRSAPGSFARAAIYQPPANLDAIALAETRAPSRPAPLLPLTGQERLLLAAARPGGPFQLAALDQARAPARRAAALARQDAEIRRYIRTMLAPIALSDALTSTRFREPPEVALSTPLPKPPQSLAF